MSDNSSKGDNSDDLISQLAQLMADDAQADRADISLGDEPNDIDSLDQDPTLPPIAIKETIVMSEPRITNVLEEKAEPVIIAKVDEPVISEQAEPELDQGNQSEFANLVPKELEEIASINVEEITSKSHDPIADLISSQLDQNETNGFQQAGDFPNAQTESDDALVTEQVVEQVVEQAQDNNPEDNFSFPPVFGLGGNSQNNAEPQPELEVEAEQAQVQYPAPTQEPAPVHSNASNVSNQETKLEDQAQNKPADDPIMDIENLIGEAVRAGIPQNQESVPNEPFAFDNDANSQADVAAAANAAQERILAASSQSEYANNSNIDNQINEDTLNEEAAYTSPKKSFMGGILGPSLAGIVLLALGGGIYWYFGTDRNQNADVPVLSANNEPQKIASNTSGEEASQSAVFDKISGESQANDNERLVSRDETNSGNENQVNRVIPIDSVTQTGLANRRVRTVTVRPDGTIVNGDSARSGSEILPVDRPNVPQLPQGTISLNASAAPVVTEPVETVPVVTAPVGTAPVETAPVETAPVGNEPAVLAVNQVIAPIPLTRPIGLVAVPVATAPVSAPLVNPNDAAVDLIASTATQTSAPAPSTAVVSTSSSPAYVQLSSQRSEATARLSLAELKARYSSIFNGVEPEIQKANLVDKGVYYRVRVPANSLANANQICANIKSAGGECFVRTN